MANVCATAGRIAARAGSDVVSLEHFSAAVDRVCHGLEKPGKVCPVAVGSGAADLKQLLCVLVREIR